MFELQRINYVALPQHMFSMYVKADPRCAVGSASGSRARAPGSGHPDTYNTFSTTIYTFQFQETAIQQLCIMRYGVL